MKSRKKSLRCFIILILLLTNLNGLSLTFSNDSLYFTVIEGSSNRVVVSALHIYDPNIDKFPTQLKCAELNIPETVEYEGVVYTVTEIEGMGRNPYIKHVRLPNSITTIRDGAFSRCDSLRTIQLSNSLEIIGMDAFYFTRLLAIEIPGSIKTIKERAFKDCRSLQTVVINDAYDNYIIENEAFSHCSINKLSLGENLISIGEKAFYDGRMTSLTLPNSLKSIAQYGFSSCRFLQSVTFNNSLEFLGGSNFCNSALRKVEIPNSLHFITGSFNDCPYLKQIVLPEDSLVITGCFNNTPIQKLHISKGVKQLRGEVFANCAALEEITVDETNNVYDSRENCNAIINTKYNTLIKGSKNTIIPNNVDTIYSLSFNGQTFKTFTIPNSVSYIGSLAFGDCLIDTLYIGKSVSYIDYRAFNWMLKTDSEVKINAIYISAKRPPILNNTVNGKVFSKAIYENCKLFVPRGYASAYYSNTDWNMFLNIEEWDAFPEEETHTYKVFGDLNGDDEINVGDISKLYELILNKE